MVDAEREELLQAIQRFEEEAKGYRAELEREIGQAYQARRAGLNDHFERALDEVETLERGEREAAIARFEEFLKRYPDDPGYTPETMFRLAELYYEQANEEFQAAVEVNAEESRLALEEGRDPPPPPVKSYARSIALYQRIITGYPNYPFLHGVYYLLAYALGEMNQGEEAQAVYARLVERFPQSPYVPEAWVRTGDWWFDAVEAGSLQRAAEAYRQLEAYPDHPLYPRALYKLGWTYYRMDDFAQSVDAFVKLLDHYVAEAGKTGEEPGGDVWPEAIQYTAIGLTDEKWGGVERARPYFQALGGRPYEADIYARMGDVYFEETKYAQAVQAYKAVLAANPLAPDAPKVQAKIVLCWSRDRRFDQEAAEREALVATYDQGTPWYEQNKGRPGPDQRGARPLRAEPAADGQLPPRPGPAVQGRGAAGGGGGRVPGRRQGLRRPREPLPALQAGQRAQVPVGRLPLQRARLRARRPGLRRRARRPLQRRPPGRRRPLGHHQLGGRDHPAAAGGAAPGAQGAPLRRPEAGRGGPRRAAAATVLENLVRDSDAYLDESGRASARRPSPTRPASSSTSTATSRRPAAASTRWWAAGPTSGVAQFAANLIIESHLTEKDWTAVEEASARLQAGRGRQERHPQRQPAEVQAGRPVQPGHAAHGRQAVRAGGRPVPQAGGRGAAARVRRQGALQRRQLLRGGAPLRERAASSTSASTAEYPKSTLADEALFRVGWNAENTYDFDKAVDRYLLLVDRYPKSTHRKDALYNAARSLENLQRYDKAAERLRPLRQGLPGRRRRRPDPVPRRPGLREDLRLEAGDPGPAGVHPPLLPHQGARAGGPGAAQDRPGPQGAEAGEGGPGRLRRGGARVRLPAA